MTTIIVNEQPLNDDTLYVADDGKCFKGGYTAILEYFIFATSWTDKRHVRRFRTLEGAQKFIAKRYGGLTI